MSTVVNFGFDVKIAVGAKRVPRKVIVLCENLDASSVFHRR